MSYERLYKPEPYASWPTGQIRAVGVAYRDAAGRGLDAATCVHGGEKVGHWSGGMMRLRAE